MKIFGIEITWPWGRRSGCQYVPPYDGELLRGPHCDPYVLHLACCSACDANEYINARAERIHKAINFTGESLSQRSPCPAEQRRPLADIYAWHGNRPTRHN